MSNTEIDRVSVLFEKKTDRIKVVREPFATGKKMEAGPSEPPEPSGPPESKKQKIERIVKDVERYWENKAILKSILLPLTWKQFVLVCNRTSATMRGKWCTPDVRQEVWMHYFVRDIGPLLPMEDFSEKTSRLLGFIERNRVPSPIPSREDLYVPSAQVLYMIVLDAVNSFFAEVYPYEFEHSLYTSFRAHVKDTLAYFPRPDIVPPEESRWSAPLEVRHTRYFDLDAMRMQYSLFFREETERKDVLEEFVDESYDFSTTNGLDWGKDLVYRRDVDFYLLLNAERTQDPELRQELVEFFGHGVKLWHAQLDITPVPDAMEISAEMYPPEAALWFGIHAGVAHFTLLMKHRPERNVFESFQTYWDQLLEEHGKEDPRGFLWQTDLHFYIKASLAELVRRRSPTFVGFYPAELPLEHDLSLYAVKMTEFLAHAVKDGTLERFEGQETYPLALE